MWLEDGLGLDISSAIADELIAISSEGVVPDNQLVGNTILSGNPSQKE
jgi:hypothetical protein